MSTFGGLYRILTMYFGFLIGKINSKVLISKYIRGLYYLQKKVKPAISIQGMNYTQNLTDVKVYYFNACLKRQKTRKYKDIDIQ